jgi:hypothetical protein
VGFGGRGAAFAAALTTVAGIPGSKRAAAYTSEWRSAYATSMAWVRWRAGAGAVLKIVTPTKMRFPQVSSAWWVDM